jgi:hypothetical protein
MSDKLDATREARRDETREALEKLDRLFEYADRQEANRLNAIQDEIEILQAIKRRESNMLFKRLTRLDSCKREIKREIDHISEYLFNTRDERTLDNSYHESRRERLNTCLSYHETVLMREASLILANNQFERQIDLMISEVV